MYIVVEMVRVNRSFITFIKSGFKHKYFQNTNGAKDILPKDDAECTATKVHETVYLQHMIPGQNLEQCDLGIIFARNLNIDTSLITI